MAYSNVSVGALLPSGSASPHNVRYAKSPGSSEHSNAGAFYVTRFLMRRYLYVWKGPRINEKRDGYNHPARSKPPQQRRFAGVFDRAQKLAHIFIEIEQRR